MKNRLFAVAILLFANGFAQAQRAATPPYELEKAQGKTILVFTPHPDDDTFCCAGTLALLAKQHNNIHIVLYTNDDKGSYDPDMSSQRLAQAGLVVGRGDDVLNRDSGLFLDLLGHLVRLIHRGAQIAQHLLFLRPNGREASDRAGACGGAGEPGRALQHCAAR